MFLTLPCATDRYQASASGPNMGPGTPYCRVRIVSAIGQRNVIEIDPAAAASVPSWRVPNGHPVGDRRRIAFRSRANRPAAESGVGRLPRVAPRALRPPAAGGVDLRRESRALTPTLISSPSTPRCLSSAESARRGQPPGPWCLESTHGGAKRRVGDQAHLGEEGRNVEVRVWATPRGAWPSGAGPGSAAVR